VCCARDCLVCVWGGEFVLCVGEFGAGLGELVCDVCGRVLCRFGGVNLCCVWDTLWRDWRS